MKIFFLQFQWLTVLSGRDVAQQLADNLPEAVVLDVMEDDIIDMAQRSFVVDDVIDQNDPPEEEESEGGGELTHRT